MEIILFVLCVLVLSSIITIYIKHKLNSNNQSLLEEAKLLNHDIAVEYKTKIEEEKSKLKDKDSKIIVLQTMIKNYTNDFNKHVDESVTERLEEYRADCRDDITFDFKLLNAVSIERRAGFITTITILDINRKPVDLEFRITDEKHKELIQEFKDVIQHKLSETH